MAENQTIKKELEDEDSRAGDPQGDNPRRKIFNEAHSDEPTPSDREPSGTPPGGDDRGPPPDSGEPLREPTRNPTNSSPDA